MNILRSLTVIGPATDSSSGLRVRLTKVPGYVCPPWANSGQRTLVIAHCNRNWFPHQRNQDTLAGIRTAPALTRRTAVMNGLPPPPPFQPPFPPQGFPPPQGPPPGPPPGLPPGPPPGPRNWFGTGPKIAVAVIAIGVAVGALWAGLTFNSAGGQNQTTQSPATAQNASDQKVQLEPTSSAGTNPFMSSVGQDQSGVAQPVSTGGAFSGDTPGLFGASGEAPSCDAMSLLANLRTDAIKARAWADAVGIVVPDIPAYVATLNPVVLRADTEVTAYGYDAEDATFLAYPAVLQAGTAVFVNGLGEPRVKCFSGKPLGEPLVIRDAIYVGPRWGRFYPYSVVFVKPAPVVIKTITVIDVHSGRSGSRACRGNFAGGNGFCSVHGDSPKCGGDRSHHDNDNNHDNGKNNHDNGKNNHDNGKNNHDNDKNNQQDNQQNNDKNNQQNNDKNNQQDNQQDNDKNNQQNNDKNNQQDNQQDNDKNNQQNNDKNNDKNNQQNNDKNNQQNNDKNNDKNNHDLPPGATTSGGDHRWRDHGERDHG
jgi:hypothetical protein